jgi:DNA end-binding protein Ku
MAPRAISSATISFGLVSIPVKVYTAASSENVSFNMLHEKCGGRIKQQLYCPKDDEVIERSDTVKGYEYAKNQYVVFTEAELKAMESERTNTLDIVEFVPLESVDLVQIEKSYYLGPDKGGQKAYKLLSGAMDRTQKIAVGRWWTRGKEQLVLVRPYKGGLILHQVYYADEVRKFDEIDVGDDVAFKPGEVELADQLVLQLAHETFETEKFRDEYRDRVMTAVEQKVAGQEITTAPEQPIAQIVDLFDALKASLGAAAARPAANVASPVKGPAKAVPAEEAAEAKAKGPKKATPKKAASKKKVAGE